MERRQKKSHNKAFKRTQKAAPLNLSLAVHVLDHVDMGCHGMDDSLGIQKMPEGYALMLNADESHFYWLRYDGVESCICWDKWAVYRGAKTDKKKSHNRLKVLDNVMSI